MYLLKNQSVLFENSHYAYWTDKGKIFHARIKSRSGRGLRLNSKINVHEKTIKELTQIRTNNLDLQRILKLHGVKILHETNKKYEKEEKIINHQKISGTRLCKCGGDVVHLNGYGWFCVNKLNEWLKQYNYKIIKTGD